MRLSLFVEPNSRILGTIASSLDLIVRVVLSRRQAGMLAQAADLLRSGLPLP